MAIKVGEMIISVNLVCNCDLLKYCHYFKRHLWKIYHFNKQFEVFGINANIHVAIIPARLVKPQKMKKNGTRGEHVTLASPKYTQVPPWLTFHYA